MFGLPELAADAHRVMGTTDAGGCPLEATYAPSAHLLEITEAVGLAADWHVPIDVALGRDPTAADLAALAALRRAQAAALRSDIAIREREAAERANRPTTDDP